MEKIKKLVKQFGALDKKKKTYLISAFVIIFVLIWAFMSAAIITGNFNRSQVRDGNKQKVDAIGIIITETKNGNKYFEIYGENGSYSNGTSIATLNNVVGNFYKNGEVAMSFQSSKGSYDETSGIITLYDNTYIVLKDETSLEADKLTWTGSDKDTVAEGDVRIKRGGKLIATAEKGIIGAGYDKFKIIGKTETKLFSNKEK